MMVQHYPNDGVRRVVPVEFLKQQHELPAAVSFFDLRHHFSTIQIQSGQNRQRAEASIFGIAAQARSPVWLGRQVRCHRRRRNRLNSRLLIHRNGRHRHTL